MNWKSAHKLVSQWPIWMEGWKKEAFKRVKTEEDKCWVHSIYFHANWKVKQNISIVQWFVHCLYKSGYKIVPK